MREDQGQREGTAPSAHLPSLLWPPGHSPITSQSAYLGPEATRDLDLDPVIQALSGGDARHARFVAGLFAAPSMDPDIFSFRLDVIDNLVGDPELHRRMTELLPRLSLLVSDRQPPIYGYDWDLGEIVRRLGELEMYVEVVQGLAEAVGTAELRAPALQELQAAVRTLQQSPDYVALHGELPRLQEQLEQIKSLTIGVNLSRDFRPESATILSIDTERLEGRNGLLGRLLGREAHERGITPLRGPATSLRSFFPPMAPNAHGHDNGLVEDLRRLLTRVVTPVGEALVRYVWAQTRDFVALESELSFLLHGAALIQHLRQAGLPVCRPEIARLPDRNSCLDDAYNLSLALRTVRDNSGGAGHHIITNPIVFDRTAGQVWVLTGPNRGGKTTYARAAGLAQLLFQVGLYVPARRARLSPADAIFTHFPGHEGATPGRGRLDEEAVRLAQIFAAATPHSLILLNEVLSGTSTWEGLALAHDGLRGLHLLGARAIYVTHLHELATHCDEINATTAGDGRVASLVAEVGNERDAGGHIRTYRIRPGPPGGRSYASEIAEQHGISYPQLLALLRERGVASGS